jgi:hypothetical protein
MVEPAHVPDLFFERMLTDRCFPEHFTVISYFMIENDSDSIFRIYSRKNICNTAIEDKERYRVIEKRERFPDGSFCS